MIRDFNLTIDEISAMSEQQARAAFEILLWSDNGGDPVCPHCGFDDAYRLNVSGRDGMFKCRDCYRQFTATSGTIFSGRKMSFRSLLAIIAIYIGEKNGASATQIMERAGCNYRTARDLCAKLRLQLMKEASNGEAQSN